MPQGGVNPLVQTLNHETFETQVQNLILLKGQILSKLWCKRQFSVFHLAFQNRFSSQVQFFNLNAI
jgi:hypothetical protein